MKKTFATLFIAFGLISLGYQGFLHFSTASVPTCDDEAVQTTAMQAIEEELIKNNREIASLFEGVNLVGLNSIKEATYNEDKDLRGCDANLITNRGNEPVFYTVKWQDRYKGEFYVEVNFK